MRTHEGDIWDLHERDYWVVVPLSLDALFDGAMDRGIAGDANARFPSLREDLVAFYSQGSRPSVYADPQRRIFGFPIRNRGGGKPDVRLIARRLHVLKKRIAEAGADRVATPLLGVGFNALKKRDVLPVMETMLDDGVTLVYPSKAVRERSNPKANA